MSEDAAAELKVLGLSAEIATAVAAGGLSQILRATLNLVAPGIEEVRTGRYSQAFGLTAYGGGIPDELSARWQAEEAQYEQTCKQLASWLLTELSPMLQAAGIAAAACPVSPAQLASLFAGAATPSQGEARAALAQLVRAGSGKA